MRKFLISMAAAVTALATIAACGSSGTGNSDAGNSQSAASGAPESTGASSSASSATDGSPAGDLTSIKIGYPSDTASYGDLYVCKDEGIFAKNGLDVDLTLLKTSSQLLAALTSGAVQIAGGDGRAVAAGAIKGTDIKMIELKLPVYFVEMWGSADIKSVADLKGKTVGVTAPGSVTDTATRIMLADKGMTDQVKVANLNSLSGLMAAAKNGSIDALVTAPPQGATTKGQGWHKITDMTKYKTAASVYAVTGDFAKNDAATVQKFVDADVQCLAYLHDKANRDKSVDAIAKYTKTSDKELAAYAYDFFVKIWATKPMVDTELVHQAFEEVAGDQKIPSDLTPFIDNSFVEKATATG